MLRMSLAYLRGEESVFYVLIKYLTSSPISLIQLSLFHGRAVQLSITLIHSLVSTKSFPSQSIIVTMKYSFALIALAASAFAAPALTRVIRREEEIEAARITPTKRIRTFLML